MPIVLFVGADIKYMLQFRGRIISAFRKMDYRTIVLATPVFGYDERQFVDIGVEFIRWNLSKTGLNPLADIPEVSTLWRILRATRPNIVFAHTIKPVIYAMILSKLAGAPRRVAMIPGLGYAFTSGDGLLRRVVATVANIAYSVALRSANIVLFQNPDDRVDLIKLGVLSPSAHTAIVHGSGVDMVRFPATPPPIGPVTFLMVARLIRDKGVYDFVEAARLVKRKIPNIRLILVGSADQNPAAVLQSEIDSWRAEGIIEVRGHLPDPQPEYAACHVFVLPSYREGTPRTNLEAMSSARAIITTDTPGCRETVVDGVNGLLIPPRDPTALAEAMLSLACDPQRVQAMGVAGRRICAERFELEAVTRSTVAHILGPAAAQASQHSDGPPMDHQANCVRFNG